MKTMPHLLLPSILQTAQPFLWYDKFSMFYSCYCKKKFEKHSSIKKFQQNSNRIPTKSTKITPSEKHEWSRLRLSRGIWLPRFVAIGWVVLNFKQGQSKNFLCVGGSVPTVPMAPKNFLMHIHHSWHHVKFQWNLFLRVFLESWTLISSLSAALAELKQKQ